MQLEELKKYARLKGNELYINRNGVWKLYIPRISGVHYVGIEGNSYRVARVMWMLSHDSDVPDGYRVVHINGNRSDDRIANLAINTCCTSAHDRLVQIKGYSGVSRVGSKFKAVIVIKGVSIYLGIFNSSEDAAAMYELAHDLRDCYENKRQFYDLLYDTYGITFGPVRGIGKSNAKGYTKNHTGKFSVLFCVAGKIRYITQFADEKEAAEFAQLAMKHKAEFVDRQQFLKLLREKY